MPTGYTNKIYEGENVSFEDYMMGCARQFGANVRMRDMPHGTKIEEYKPNTGYYERRLEHLEKELKALNKMSNEEIEKLLKTQYKIEVERYENNKKEKVELKEKYEAMFEKVKKWMPPTEEHLNLKEFALQQLISSIKGDCVIWKRDIKKETVEEYKFRVRESTVKDIEYYNKKIKEEIQRTKQANKWNQELFESLQETN